jgi:RNA polymerase sigma factor (sigma-70 family)
MEDAVPTDGLEARELLRHVAHVRALARILVGIDDFEDVSQDALVLALERPPRRVGALREWLRSVVTNLSRARARGEGRREARERRSARPEALPPTDAVVAQAELHRRLVEGLLALDEPYRGTLLLHFFQGLPPREIARRGGTSPEAVRQRLKRGIDRLRAEFDGENGGRRDDWRDAWIAVLQLPAPAAPALPPVSAITIASKGVAVSMKSKGMLAAAALVVAGLAGWWTLRARGDGDLPRARPVARDLSGADSKASTPTPVASASEQTATRRSASDLAGSSADAVRFVYGAAVDVAGATLPKSELRMWSSAPNDRSLPTRQSPWSESIERGAYAIAGLAPGKWSLELRVPGFRTVERTFDVAEGDAARRLDLVASRAVTIPVWIETPKGTPLFDACPHPGKGHERHSCLFTHLAIVALADAPPEQFPPNDSANSSHLGVGRFLARSDHPLHWSEETPPLPAGADGAIVTARRPPLWVALLLKHVVVAHVRVDDPEAGVRLVVDPEAITRLTGSVHLRVVDPETHAPLAKRQIFAGDRQGWWHAEVFTDADGVARIVDVPPGLLPIDFWETEREELSLRVRVDPGADVDAGTVALARAVSIEGSIRDDAGRPVAAFLRAIDLDRRRDHSPFDRGPTAHASDDGVFRFGSPSLGGIGRGRFLIVAESRDHAIASALVDTSQGFAAPLELRAPIGTPVTFQDLRFEEGMTYELADASGRTIDADIGFGSLRLVPGRYVLTAWREDSMALSLPFELGTEAATVVVPVPAGGIAANLLRVSDALAPSDRSDAAGALAPPVPARLDPDPVGIVSFGRIGAASDVRCGDGSIEAVGSDGQALRGTVHRGCYAIPGLSAGHVELFAAPVGRSACAQWLDVAALPPVQRHDVALTPTLVVDVHLVDSTTGLPPKAQWRFQAEGAEPRVFLVVATVGAPPSKLDLPALAPRIPFAFGAGRFSWRDASGWNRPGLLEIAAPLPVHVSVVSGGRVVASRLVSEAVDEITLAVPPAEFAPALCSLRIRLIAAEDGTPLTPSCLNVLHDVGEVMFSRDEPRTPIDRSGTYLLERLAAGPGQLIVRVPGRGELQAPIELLPGNGNDLGVLSMGRAVKLRGRLTDENGEFVRARVTARPMRPEDASARLGLATRAFSDVEGAFELEVGRGRAEVVVSDPRFALLRVVIDANEEGDAPLELELQRGAPVAVSVDPALDANEIAVETADGAPLLRRTIWVRALRLRLGKGHHRAVAWRGGVRVGSTEFDVGEAPVEVRVGG